MNRKEMGDLKLTNSCAVDIDAFLNTPTDAKPSQVTVRGPQRLADAGPARQHTLGSSRACGLFLVFEKRSPFPLVGGGRKIVSEENEHARFRIAIFRVTKRQEAHA
jgi:hypothetical protein